MNLHVIGPVAGQPVELVNDAERDAGAAMNASMPFRPLRLCRARGFPGINGLAHDARPVRRPSVRWRGVGRGSRTLPRCRRAPPAHE